MGPLTEDSPNFRPTVPVRRDERKEGLSYQMKTLFQLCPRRCDFRWKSPSISVLDWLYTGGVDGDVGEEHIVYGNSFEDEWEL